MGQLLVVARHTDTSPSSCYEPELFSGPLATGIGITVNGPGNCSLVYIISGVRHMQPRCEEYGPGNSCCNCGILTAIVQVASHNGANYKARMSNLPEQDNN